MQLIPEKIPKSLYKSSNTSWPSHQSLDQILTIWFRQFRISENWDCLPDFNMLRLLVVAVLTFQFITDNAEGKQKRIDLHWHWVLIKGSIENNYIGCGEINASDRIVNGNKAKHNSIPWQVALVLKGKEKPFCPKKIEAP